MHEFILQAVFVTIQVLLRYFMPLHVYEATYSVKNKCMGAFLLPPKFRKGALYGSRRAKSTPIVTYRHILSDTARSRLCGCLCCVVSRILYQELKFKNNHK